MKSDQSAGIKDPARVANRQATKNRLGEDVSEQARIEERISRQYKFVSDVLESLPHPFYVVDPTDYTVMLANGAAREKGLCEGVKCHVASHGHTEPCGANGHSCPIVGVLATGQPAVVEHVHHLPDGQLEHVEIRGFPIQEEQGKVDRVIIYSLDVTERKRAEQAQAKLLGCLEQANAELNEFAYAVSHDLKAPLRGIRSLANWIAADYSDKLDQDGKEQLGLLQSRVDRMQNLIDGILQYSRIGRTDEERMRVDLNEHVAEVIDMLDVPDNIEVIVEGELPILFCNETRIRHIFQNLIGNAVKYMDKPNGRVTVRCGAGDDGYQFSVTDNGPGIEQEHFERIFKVFQTLTPRDESGGTGIGLSLVKKSVESCGGKVWVESTLGRGSTFWFTLPKHTAEPQDRQLQLNATG